MHTWSSYRYPAKLLKACLAIVLCLQPISLAAPVQDTGILFATPSAYLGDCSRVKPCLFREALARAVEGDTIYFSKGDYYLSDQDPEGGEAIHITASISLLGGWDGYNGEDGSPIERDPQEYVSHIISQGACSGFFIAGTDPVDLISPVIDGFTITSGTSSPDCLQDMGSAGGYAIRSVQANPTISHNIFQDARGAAIISLENSSATVDSNLFSNITPFTENSSLAAISAYADTALTEPLLIANNFLVGDPQGSDVLSAVKVDVIDPGSLNVEILYNTLSGFSSGIDLVNSAKASASYNIFTDTAIGATTADPDNLLGELNLFFDSANPGSTPSPFGLNPVSGDPLFADPAANNYHILAGSAARKKGVCRLEVRTDFDGDPRPELTGCDLGADQIISTNFSIYLPSVVK